MRDKPKRSDELIETPLISSGLLSKRSVLIQVRKSADRADERLRPEDIRKLVVDTYNTLCEMMDPPQADMGALIPIASQLEGCVARAIEVGDGRDFKPEIESIRNALRLHLN